MDAASAASARPAEKTSTKCSGVPAPPDAITGIWHGGAHGRRQLAVEAGSRAVAIDRRQQNLAGAAIGRFARPSHGLARLARRAAAANTSKPASPRFASIATMTAWLPYVLGDSGDERGIGQRRAVQADLVRARVDHGAGVVHRSNAAADGERNEDAARDFADRVEQRAAALERRRDVEDGQLVDALAVVARRQLRRIAGVAQAEEVDALDDAAVADVEAGDESFGQHRQRPSRTTPQEVVEDAQARRPGLLRVELHAEHRDRVRRPTRTARRASSSATCRGPTGAANECVKYADAPAGTPRSRRDGRASASQRVPADVRDLDVAAQPKAAAGQQAEAGSSGRLVAALEQPLQAEADAEQRHAARRSRA